jgi:excisionase family DNA binding protein
MNDKLLGIDVIAGRLGVSREQVYRMVRAGEIPAYRVGNLWRFKEAEVEEWLAAQKFLAVAE